MTRFRIGIARLWHESNSFAGTQATIDDFRNRSSYSGVDVGEEMLAHPERRNEVTGFVEAFKQDGNVEIVPLMSAGTLPSGLVTAEAAGFLEETLRREIRKAGPLDGICFAPHGAVSATTIPDLDGHFLNVFREELGPDIPIVCSLDCHAVVTRRMVDFSTALVAYRTHPHMDLVETGMRAARILLDTLRGKVKPVMRCQKIPLLFVDAGTDRQPLRRLFDEFIAWDRTEGVMACSLCTAYPYQDVTEQGWAALSVTDDDPDLAERLARQLAENVWNERRALLPEPMFAPEEAILEAAATPGCPVVIADSADNIGGGADGDTTTLLSVLLAMCSDVDGLILAHLPDMAAVAALATAKVGDTVTVRVGGKRSERFSAPVTVTGQILCKTNGCITNDGKFGPAPTIDIGETICLGIDNLRLVLTEHLIMGPQPSLFRKVGIEPFDAKIVALKSGGGYKVTYGHVAKAVLHADCPGAMSFDVRNFDFKNVPRPILPLDCDFEWRPQENANGTAEDRHALQPEP